ncbi:Protein NLRC3, partial [Nibea albiflora]
RWPEPERPDSPTPSNVSLKSDWSKNQPISFNNEESGWPEPERPDSPTPSNVSLKSDWSKNQPISFNNEDSGWPEPERPDSPTPSNVSLKSDWSKNQPISFNNEESGWPEPERPDSPTPSNVSLKSDWSKNQPISFNNEESGWPEPERPDSPTPSNVSLKSDWSKNQPISFNNEESGWPEPERPDSPTPSNVSLKSDWSKNQPISFNNEESGWPEPERPDSPTPSNVSLKSDWSKNQPISFNNEESGWPEPERPDSPTPSNVSLKVTGPRINLSASIMKNQEKKEKLTAALKKRILSQYEEELRKHETDTELYEIGEGHKEDKKQTYDTLFLKSNKKVRTVLMKGVADIGKTFQAKRFMVGWAKGKSNKDIDFIVSLNFSELNSIRDQEESMKDLLRHSLTDNEHKGVCKYDDCKIAFVLDGLEKCELPLDFEKNKDLTDLEEPASMDVLLTNLIKGNLLPSALLWIISQPSGVDKIPRQYINKLTECGEKKEKLTAALKKRILRQYGEELGKHETDTELYEIGEGNKQDTKQTYDTLFLKSNKKVRTVLMKGVADIGKTFQAKRFMVDWAKGKSNKEIDFIVSLNFSELNSKRDHEESMKDLLRHSLTDNEHKGVCKYDDCKIAFVLDGLEKCELPLYFEKNKDLTDLEEPASMDVLLTNLIKGNLLPSALLWIISQPSGVDKIPRQYIEKVTECQGKPDIESKQKLKTQLKKQFTHVSEGVDMQKTSALLNDIYTDLYIVEGERGEVNDQHETRQVQDAKFKPVTQETLIKYHDIFKPTSGEINP